MHYPMRLLVRLEATSMAPSMQQEFLAVQSMHQGRLYLKGTHQPHAYKPPMPALVGSLLHKLTDSIEDCSLLEKCGNMKFFLQTRRLNTFLLSQPLQPFYVPI